MNLEVRSVAAGIDPAFEQAWNKRLARSPHANFGFSIDHLAHEAGRGGDARLVLVDDGPFAGALVLREEGRELVCGWPWRLQALVEGADPARPDGMSECDALRLFEVARQVAGRQRLRFHSPHPCGGAIECHPAGSTVLVDLAGGDEDRLFGGMDRCKRSCVRRARREGFEIAEGLDVERERAFAAILDDLLVQRHGHAPDPPGDTPAPGEGWRSWERPWHSALFALERDRVVAGYGWGWRPGGMADGRANACTEDGRRRGANILLVWEVLRRAGARGHTWMNLGGATRFKREFGGRVMPVYCRLGGGIEWLGPNLVENLLQGEGRRVARAVLTRVSAARHETHAGRP